MNIKDLFNDDRGSILPITVGVIFIFLAFIAIVVDFGRYTVAKEKLQIASDAASLAGAKSSERIVRLKIDQGERRDPCCYVDEDGNCQACCVDECNHELIVEDTEVYLLENEGWRDYCCSCGCAGMEIIDRWVNYKNGGSDSVKAANAVFEMNKPEEMDESTGGSSYITIDPSYLSENKKFSPLYPSVIVQAHGRVRTLLLDFLKVVNPHGNYEYINASTCSQGRTYYKEVYNGKWNSPPDSYCDE